MVKRLAFFVAIAFSGCSAGGSVVGTPPAGLSAVSQARPQVDLFVPESDNIYVYAPGSPKLLKSLPISAGALLADANGNLYTVYELDIAHQLPANVASWAPGGSPQRYDIKKGLGLFNSWAISRSGDLYVSTSKSYGKPSRIAAFAPGSKIASYTISNGQFLGELATDRAGNLFAATFPEGSSAAASVVAFRPGVSTAFREITQGLNAPSQLLFDSHENLYVVNAGTPSSISVYGLHASKPTSAIATGISCPCPAAVGNGELYVGNYRNGTIAVYAVGATATRRVLHVGEKGAVSILALDPSGNLYACCAKSGIVVYRAGRNFWYDIPLQSYKLPAALVFARS